MTIYRGPYYGADGCDSSARAGTDALVSWFLGAYRSRGAANLGTYVCKRLGSGWSIHAERRAADLGTSPYGGVDSEWGWALANALRLNSAELGVQLIILGQKVWSCRYPDSGWRSYSGEHHGHMHVELTPAASTSLTVTKIQNTIGGKSVALTEEEIGKIANAVWAHQHNHPTRPGERQTKGTVIQYMDAVHDAKTEEVLDALPGPVQVDYDRLADAIVRRVLTPPPPDPEGS